MNDRIRQIDGLIKELSEIEQTLGRALGYPKYADDPKNFPEATVEDGVCVGEHVAATIAEEAAARIRGLTQELGEARAKLTYYEAPLPEIKGKRYDDLFDHRFSDDGICVRCGEDAEEWDAGCVETLVNSFMDEMLKAQAAYSETAGLRDGITKAVGMPWIAWEQPLGGTAYKCPDDVAIIAYVAEMAQRAQGA